MIRAEEAISTARSLIGTPYSEMDCMAMIVQVIRRSAGGEKDYRCQGTNWLWASIENSGKYRHLTWRREGIAGAKAGMIAFKRTGSDVHHAGIVTEKGTVVHSSSTQGGRGVVETPLTAREGWNLLGRHRYIEIGEEDEAMEKAGRARVVTKNDPLSLRDAPVSGAVIGKLPIGAIVTVYGEGSWPKVTYNGMQGYASAAYLERIEEAQTGGVRLILTDEMGNTWTPEGGFTAEIRETED